MRHSREQDRLGWFPAGRLGLSIALLVSLVGSAAWADSTLDLDKEIRRQEADAAQIVNTLGRGKAVNQNTSKDAEKSVKVELRPTMQGRSDG